LRHQPANQVKTRLRFSFVSSPPDSGSATAFGGAFARNHGSRLFTHRLLFSHSPAASFLTPPAFGSFFTRLARPSWPSRCALSFCPPFGVFLLANSIFYFESCQSRTHRADSAVATKACSGNCDSFRLETCLNYLTRLGAVSNRPLPPFPHSHLARANVPEEPVNFASAARPFGQFKRSRANQPNPTCPRSPGIILETNNFNFSTAAARFTVSRVCVAQYAHRSVVNSGIVCPSVFIS
jgi:hypothetical protein